ncbi:ATP-binding protein [Halobacteriovorax sp.]|uniref:ATP-binding protein n=1 Tax=Halobacteriovorax sp. TaxID=2020862 RepID=UPI003AF30FC1
MFGYLDILDSQFWSNIGFAFLAMAAGCYYLSLAITGLHLKRIGQGQSKHRVKTYLMAFSQSIVCFLVLAKYFFPIYSDKKVLVSLLLFTFGCFSKLLYWNNLSYYFKESSGPRIFYKIVIFSAIFVSVIHIIFYFIEGGGSCCLAPNVINETTSEILKIQVPFKVSSLLQGFQSGYIIVVWLIYFSFFYKALKTNDLAMKIGLGLSVANVFYTLSYFVFDFQYWIPLFFLTDIVEYTRLQRVEINQINNDFKEQREKEAKLLHDISNPLQHTWTRLRRIIKDKSNQRNLDIDKDVNSLYMATTNAIDILNKYRQEDEKFCPISLAINDVIKMYDDVNIDYIPPQYEVDVNCQVIKNTLINLIKNSIEALGEDLKWIKIEVNSSSNELHLKYIDSGLYSDFKKPQNAFKYGYSSKEGRDRGIGLASVKADIEKIGGRIKLGPFQDNTCFDIYL